MHEGMSLSDSSVPPTTKFSITSAVLGDGHVVVSWTTVLGAVGYRVEYGVATRTDTRTIKTANTTFTVAGLDNGSTYYFMVIAQFNTGTSTVTPKITVTLPRRSGLQPRQLGVLVNDNDPESVAIGDYYRIQRHIPSENIVHLNVPKVVQLSRTEFMALKTQVDGALRNTVQALAIAWTNPSRVECNSITSAFTLGFMEGPCNTGTCNWATSSPYFNSNSSQPFTDFNMRPAMMLAALNMNQAKALIQRGIASDGTNPSGSAYIMNTGDSVRSLRARIFPNGNLGTSLSSSVNVKITNADWISGTTDALFYFQGLERVSNIATNTFPPGAVADHLTSYGGMLTDSYQMSALEFIAGGATGTFGTVSEPCAYSQKFPDPSIMISRYTKGDTLIEAYWKSVLQTFQGAFVGEPLANPWKKITS